MTSNEPFSPIHGDSPNHILTEMLSHLEHQPDRVIQNLERRQDRRQAVLEPDIDDSADDLADLANGAFSGELIGDLTSRRRRAGFGRRGDGGGG